MRPLIYNSESTAVHVMELMVGLDVAIVASTEHIEDMQDEPWDESLMS